MLNIGTIYRFPQKQQKDKPIVDGLPNYFYETNTSDVGFFFQRGIHNVGKIELANGKERCPLVIISSTPSKSDSKDNPWHDRYDPDHGYVKYYGDNNESGRRAEDAPGNRLLLDSLKYYDTEDFEQRQQNAIPVVFFERCTYEGRTKGNMIFQGFGVLESAELVTQYNLANEEFFSNYLFTFCIFSLASEGECFNWDWIRDRCNPNLNDEDTLKHAPEAWKRWIKEGKESLHLIRRSVSGRGLVKQKEQESNNPSLLKQIYDYYGGKKSNTGKHAFEFLAMEATVKTIEESGATCVPGWITKASGDGGVDFVLRIDIGTERLASVKIVVLGQAKCTDPQKAVNGKDIARTVARMKRGWIGAFVTTSYFSEPVQREVNEDAYPLIMINGAKITSIVEREMAESKLTLAEYLESLNRKYKQTVRIAEDVNEL